MSSKSMKAVVYRKVGAPGVLEFTTVEKPIPGLNDVRLRVNACALNLLDYYLRIEDDPDVPMPHILGSDVSGVIDMVGDGVDGWQEGDEVVVSPTTSCGHCQWCRNGEDSMCDSRGILGYQTQGGYAEYIVVPARNLVKKPQDISHIEAASFPLVSVTAYRMVFHQGQLKPGDRVLVMGGSSGVGSLAVQLCKSAGAWVITTVGFDWKIKQAKELGADEVVLHSDKEWSSQVLDATQGKGVDLVCEHIGGDFLSKCVELLSQGGRLVTIGSTLGSELHLDNFELYRKQASLIGSYMGSIIDLQKVLDLVEFGFVKPVVHKEYKLEDAKDAHICMEERAHFGKIVLVI